LISKKIHFVEGEITTSTYTTASGYGMKPYDELQAAMGVIQWQTVKSRNNQRANAVKEFRRLCNRVGFAGKMTRGSLDGGETTL